MYMHIGFWRQGGVAHINQIGGNLEKITFQAFGLLKKLYDGTEKRESVYFLFFTDWLTRTETKGLI